MSLVDAKPQKVHFSFENAYEAAVKRAQTHQAKQGVYRHKRESVTRLVKAAPCFLPGNSRVTIAR